MPGLAHDGDRWVAHQVELRQGLQVRRIQVRGLHHEREPRLQGRTAGGRAGEDTLNE